MAKTLSTSVNVTGNELYDFHFIFIVILYMQA
jgi:hypothetical protein